MPPLQLGMHPICSASHPGPQSLSQNFYQPCTAGAAFLSRIKLPKVCRQHLMHHSSPQRKGQRRSGQLSITSGSVIIGHLQEAPRDSDHQTPTCRSTKTDCILPGKTGIYHLGKTGTARCINQTPGAPVPTQSNDKCGFYNYFSQLLTGLPTVLMNHRLAAIVC